MKLLII